MKTELKTGTKIYSVNEITTHIKDLIMHDRILQKIWVKGEISNFRHSNNVHMYFSLKDEESIIGCAMFRGVNQKLGFTPQDGMKVMICGHVDVYKPQGKYQIIIEEMHLEGEGELYLKFLQLKSKLEKEGFFKPEHKKPLPEYPQIIGVVTSPQGSVIQDIIKVIKRRYPHINLIIYPSLVQGDEAKYTIVKGIEVLNKLNVDVIIIARGGGSFEDLWPFNEEIVAKEVYNSNVPIVSAIGYQTDVMIIDFVADKSAPTPSAAAELVVPNEEEIINNLSVLKNRLGRSFIKVIEFYRHQIHNIINRPLLKKPFRLIESYMQFLDETSKNLKERGIDKIGIIKSELRLLDGKLNALNPYAVLKRGYSITMKNDKVVSSVKNIKVGDILSTIIKDGEIKSKIENKNDRKIL